MQLTRDERRVDEDTTRTPVAFHAPATCGDTRVLVGRAASRSEPAFGSCLVLYPKSVIRGQSDFVLPPCRLAAAFVEGVAGYVETKRQTRCRRQDERAWKAGERLASTRQGGLMTDLGLYIRKV